MAGKSPDELLTQAVESARNIKFGRGVVSKTSYVAAPVVAVWGIIAWQWSENLIADAGLLVAGLAATLFAGWYVKETQKFAQQNPAQALLDGAEFLEWTRMGAATKALPSPPKDQPAAELTQAQGQPE